MEKYTRSGRPARFLQVGEEVLVYEPTSRRKKNAGEPQWDGPWIVVELGERETDYLIKRKGSKGAPKMMHIDRMERTAEGRNDGKGRAGTNEEVAAEKVAEEHLEVAKDSAPVHEVLKVCGERQLAGQKQLLLQWTDESYSWEPEANLSECGKRVQEWEMKSVAVRAATQRRAEAALAGGVDAVAVNLVLNLLDTEQGRMIRDVCNKLQIDIKEVAMVAASPPCETYTITDASNQTRGNNYRQWGKKTEARRRCDPRIESGDPAAEEKRQKAELADELVRRLVESIAEDQLAGESYHFIVENPRGALRRRPFMKTREWLRWTKRDTVDYCSFDHEVQKPTDFWMDKTLEWTPKGTTGDGKCHARCNHGKRTEDGNYQHNKVLAGETARAFKGKFVKEQK
jgi:hypothetical protein